MKNRNAFPRRTFLKLSSLGVLAGITGKVTGNQSPENLSPVDEVVRKVGILPRHRLGYSQREVSVLIGAGDMHPMRQLYPFLPPAPADP